MFERISSKTTRNTVVAGSLLAFGLFAASVVPVNADPPNWAPAHGYRRNADENNGGSKHHERTDHGTWVRSGDEQDRTNPNRDQNQRWHRKSYPSNAMSLRDRQRQYWARLNADRQRRYRQQAQSGNQQRWYWAHQNANRSRRNHTSTRGNFAPYNTNNNDRRTRWENAVRNNQVNH